MLPTAPAAFASVVAARIQADRDALAMRWLTRLQALVPVDAHSIFPTAALLDHIPTLVEHIGQFLVAPEEDIAANTFVLAKARELGVLRHAQHASVHQLLREYELLRNILQSFVLEQSEQLQLSPDVADVIQFLRRVDQAIGILTQVTVDTFIALYTDTITEQTRRLEGFNRLVSHELRQPLGVLHMAVRMVRVAESTGEPNRRDQALDAIERNLSRLTQLVERITNLSRTRAAQDVQAELGTQRVSITTVAAEAARQLRDMSDTREVEVRIAPNLPDVVVEVGQMELMLTNLLSNAIKYSDPAKSPRFVEVASVDDPPGCTFHVRDNGLGMDDEQLRSLFTPFYRAHADRDADLQNEGVGLGLTIVRDCASAMGATVSVESAAAQGSTFTVTLPAETCGRDVD